jgi:hypothetical protein
MSEKSTPPVSRAWPRSGSWKSSSTSWPGSRRLEGLAVQVVRRDRGHLGGDHAAHRVADQVRAGEAERSHHVPAVQGEVEHVLQQLLAGGLAVARELGGEDVVARGELVEERVVREEAARAVEEHHRHAAARLQHAAARALPGLDREGLHHRHS